MNVRVVEIIENWVIIEYTQEGMLQRRSVPRSLSPTTMKGPANFSAELVFSGMEYSNVDLIEALGETFQTISVSTLQNTLRQEGLWTAADYKKHPDIVRGVVQRLVGVSVTKILNAAAKHT